ncbi:MAG: glycosyltransferase family 2 protein [Planctomycetaceae bacterium]|jgi:glycosyltransferase involved in cell wall biosynthesis|nr:glycosyltransferase family 2 protein [Planctomycetaceae bacterium]
MVRIPIFTSLTETISKEIKIRTHSVKRRKPESLAVVITTYNNPAWLEKVLWGYSVQNYSQTPVKIIIADDGSTKETRLLIEKYRKNFPWDLVHLWHPDQGFQKTRILNRAIVAAKSDYLIFTDHDCIPRNDFLTLHFEHAELGYFLSGSYVKLSQALSHQLTQEDIVSGRAFCKEWLKSQGFLLRSTLPKLTTNKRLAMFLNWVTTTDATWNGHCSSCWQSDALAINGFNESMGYGGEDREFGERLCNFGIKAKQLRYSFPCMHLDHDRPYAIPESITKNKAIRKETRQSGRIETSHGIRQMLEEETNDGYVEKSFSQPVIYLPLLDGFLRRAG